MFPNIPKANACDGAGRSLPLTIKDVPAGTQTLALIMDDVDAKGYIHWVLWNISPQDQILPENFVPPGISQGMTSGGKNAYEPPCPPSGQQHRYRVQLYALRKSLGFSSPPTAKEMEAAMQGNVIDRAEIGGIYASQK